MKLQVFIRQAMDVSMQADARVIVSNCYTLVLSYMTDNFLNWALYITNGTPLLILVDTIGGRISHREAYNWTIDFRGPRATVIDLCPS